MISVQATQRLTCNYTSVVKTVKNNFNSHKSFTDSFREPETCSCFLLMHATLLQSYYCNIANVIIFLQPLLRMYYIDQAEYMEVYMR